jgi:predicted DsbA family dithiol-disulfide isomerase
LISQLLGYHLGMTNGMTVEIWADLVCPWCGLGEHRFEAALEQFVHRGDVDVVHRSFQLDPSLPIGATQPVREHLARKFGSGEAAMARLASSQRNIEAMARDEGLSPYHVADNVTGSTALAHELLAYATAEGRGADAWRNLSRAYFGEQQSIFDTDALVDLAAKMGLDPGAVRTALETRQYRGQVAADQREAQQLGATGVPFFVFDRRYGVMGAQPADVLLDVLQRAWHDTHPHPSVLADESVICGPEVCAAPASR